MLAPSIEMEVGAIVFSSVSPSACPLLFRLFVLLSPKLLIIDIKKIIFIESQKPDEFSSNF